MRAQRTALRRHRRGSVFELLKAAWDTPDEAAWYAQRLELLGRTIFGDLWESPPAETEKKPSANHEA